MAGRIKPAIIKIRGDNVLKNIIRRIISTIVVLLGVSIIAFALVRLAPGDPALQMLPATATQEQIDNMHKKMGLDQPLLTQYLTYMKNAVKGDLGYSYHYQMNCSELIMKRLPETAKLTFLALLIVLIISIPLGLVAGVKKGSAIDTFSMFFALLGQSLSPVWLGLLMVLIFGVYLGWLPTQGYGSFKYFIMPSICLAFGMCSLVTRMLRSGMIDVLQEDYITATRARGISRMQVYVKYAFKNALLPIITVLGSQIGTMMAGSMVVEQIFGWPGLGQLTVDAINYRDFSLVQSILLISAVIFVLCNLICDILYTFVDKRIKFN